MYILTRCFHTRMFTLSYQVCLGILHEAAYLDRDLKQKKIINMPVYCSRQEKICKKDKNLFRFARLIEIFVYARNFPEVLRNTIDLESTGWREDLHREYCAIVQRRCNTGQFRRMVCWLETWLKSECFFSLFGKQPSVTFGTRCCKWKWQYMLHLIIMLMKNPICG